MMNSNELINNMKKELNEEIKNNKLTLETLDEITYECVENLKKVVLEEATKTINE